MFSSSSSFADQRYRVESTCAERAAGERSIRTKGLDHVVAHLAVRGRGIREDLIEALLQAAADGVRGATTGEPREAIDRLALAAGDVLGEGYAVRLDEGL